MRAVANAEQVGGNPAPALAARAEKILRQSTYPALWTVRYQQTDGALILRGRVPRFFLKQLAQVLVAKALSGGQILNEIEVVDPCAATPTLSKDQASMCVTLDTLELTRDELEQAKERVRQLAYLKWETAGRPFDGSTKFWHEAERQWIEHEYTPHRDDTVARR